MTPCLTNGYAGEHCRNPVSGPIADVVNFLVHLLEEGYQSRSLNSFHSAISPVHDPVGGVEVGEHPTISEGCFSFQAYSA